MKRLKRILAVIVILAMSITMMPVANVNAATKPKLNKKKATICVGKTIQLKVENNKKKVKWFTSNKKIATVSAKGKVKGKKAGKVTITAKVGKKKYKCKVTVKNVFYDIKKAFGGKTHEDTLWLSTCEVYVLMGIEKNASQFEAFVEITPYGSDESTLVLLKVNSKGRVNVDLTALPYIHGKTKFKAKDFHEDYECTYTDVNVLSYIDRYEAYEYADSGIRVAVSSIDVLLYEFGFDVSDIFFTNY